MANTTNFGWETPDDTDLVKDGAAAMRTLGNSIDASFVDLKGGTTGQVLAKNSNTDLDFTWTAADPLSILDAKGDLISATAADTPARLAVGTNGQYLKANSSTSTGLEWADISAGGMTLITTGSMASTTSLTLSSIPQTYKDLIIDVSYYNTSSTNGSTFGLRPNNSTATYRGYSGSYAVNHYTEDGLRIANGTLSSDGGYADLSRCRITIFDYTYSQANGKIGGYLTCTNQSGVSTFNGATYFWLSSLATAITSLTFYASATMQRGTIRVYGVS